MSPPSLPYLSALKGMDRVETAQKQTKDRIPIYEHVIHSLSRHFPYFRKNDLYSNEIENEIHNAKQTTSTNNLPTRS